MNTPPEESIPDQEQEPPWPDPTPVDPVMEERLSGAYRRILRAAIYISVIGVLAATVLVNWHCGLGLAVGALLAYINFVWLHRGTERLVQKMISAGTPGEPDKTTEPDKVMESNKTRPQKVRFAFPFPLRYALLFGVAYVILKSYPRLLIGFIVGLILPMLAAMGEGIYEALVTSKIDQAND
jgi:hypothetical protein